MKRTLTSLALALAALSSHAIPVTTAFTIWDDNDVRLARYSMGEGGTFATIGRNVSQYLTGFAEFSLAAPVTGTVWLEFVVGNVYLNPTPGSLMPAPGPTAVSAYHADGLANKFEKETLSFVSVGLFASTLSNRVRFDVTDAYATAIAAGDSHLGFKFMATAPAGTNFLPTYTSIEVGSFDLGGVAAPPLQLGAIVPHAPEPETWALMMAGLAALGWRARKR